MFEQNKDFFPTPKSLIQKMFSKIDWNCVSSILEPSAGNGAIVEEVEKKIQAMQHPTWSREKKKCDIDCIEIDKNLQMILHGKGYRVIHDDFLTYEGYKKYSLIIANYPFSDGDKHLSKSLDMITQGGQLVALINANTLRNPYSNIRKDLIRKLNEYNADIEYLQNEFVNAERKTNVEVALVKVTIEQTNKDSIILNKLKQEEKYNKNNINSNKNLIEGDFIKGAIRQYNFEIKAGLNLISEYKNLESLMSNSFKKDYYARSILCLTTDTNKRNNVTEPNIENEYIKKVRYKYWEALFNNGNFTKLLTTNLLYKYREKINELKDYDFSYYNIKEIQKQMSKSMVQGVEDTILNLFEEFSYKHSWDKASKNIHYYNGWKTNSAFKINKKIIIMLSAYGIFGDRLDYGYKFYEKIKDIEHVFDYLDNGETEDKDLKTTLDEAQNNLQTKKIITKYFSIDVFKKGSCHITFKNEELLKKFNIFGSQKKGFLPNSYGKKSYKNMTNEEKQVIDEFEGKESYEKVVNNTDYYIYNPSKTLMLTQ